MTTSTPGGRPVAPSVLLRRLLYRRVLVVVPLLVFAAVAAPLVRSAHSPGLTALAMTVVAGYLVTILVALFQRGRGRA